MFNQFFQLQSNPFSSTPPAENYGYLPFSHRVVLQKLNNDLDKSKGLLLLIGATGIGKSTLVKVLLEKYREKNARVALKDLTPEMHLRLIEQDYTEAILKSLSDGSSTKENKSATTVFLLDNPENLSYSFLKILLLKVAECNLNNKSTLLILTGRPQFEAVIKTLHAELSQPLDIKSYLLMHLKRQQVKNYISHRLFSAGYPSNYLFSDEAIEQVTELSKGIPRIINNICSLSIFRASSNKISVIDGKTVRQSAEFLFSAENAPDTKENLKKTNFDSIQFRYLDYEMGESLNQIKTTSSPITFDANDSAEKKPGSSSINEIAAKQQSASTAFKEQDFRVDPVTKKHVTPKIIPELASNPAPQSDTSAKSMASLSSAVAAEVEIKSKESVYNTSFFNSNFKKIIKETTLIILFVALIMVINPQKKTPASIPAKSHSKSTVPIGVIDVNALLADGIKRDRYQELDRIIARAKELENKKIIASKLYGQNYWLNIALLAKNKEKDILVSNASSLSGEKHLSGKEKKQSLFQEASLKFSQTKMETAILDKKAVIPKVPVNNSLSLSYLLFPEDAGYIPNSINIEFYKQFFAIASTPASNADQMLYYANVNRIIATDPLSILVLTDEQ